jgi:hypothetical protein
VPTALTYLTDLPVTAEPRRKRWTRAEYWALPEEVVGYERLELV